MTEQFNAEMQEIKIHTDVLVIGGGYTGLNAAKRIADAGYPVVLLETGLATLPGGLADEVKKNPKIETLTGTLISNQGEPGDFTVRLKAGNEEVEKRVGAVVLATECSSIPLNEQYGLALSDKIITLSRLEAELAGADKARLANKTVAFLFGFAQENHPLIMERVFRNVLALEAIEGCTPYVYAGNLKVAQDGLERIYLESRNQGATYFKLKEAPKVESGGASISFLDPVLGKEMELTPDLIVLEESMIPDPLNVALAAILRVDLGPGAFFQTDNVHRFPVRSNREGVFVVGGARNIQTMPSALMDVENAVLELKGLLNNGKAMVQVNKAVLDIGKCTFCLTCYRCCPHGAILWDQTNKPVILPLACQACGICASECPMNAIQIGGFHDADILAELKNGKAPAKDSPKIVAFCCQNSAHEAGIMAEAYGLPKPANLQMIKVPCAGKVDLDYMMNAFVEGADGLMIMACHAGNCKSERGNTYAKWRVEDLHRMMEEMGLEKERLEFVTLASNMGGGFSETLTGMEKKLKDLKK
jgi:heterodisulfide reductase subunit A-like polyferredoxin/coenzyme F420-reducing hydrogenase delta subunit